MESVQKIIDTIIERNIAFNEILEANQQGYIVKFIETNHPEQYQEFPGYKVISQDELFTKVRVFLRTNPLTKTRLDEKPRDTDKSHFIQYWYKDGIGCLIINKTQLTQKQLNKLIKYNKK